MAPMTPFGPVITGRSALITARGAGLIVTAIVMPVVATLWTCLRVWTRKARGLSPFFTEDILCYSALFFYWGLGINYICMVAFGGAGNHLAQLRPYHVHQFSKAIFASQVLYAVTLSFTKMSITWMIKRIFFESSHNWIPYLAMVCNFCWMMQAILTGVLVCQPVTLNWDPKVRDACGNQRNAFAAISIVDIATDILIISLPIRILWSLQMRRTYKVAVACMFGAGLITVAFTAVRLHSIFTLDFRDMTYNFISVSIVGMIQAGVAVVVASAPLLRPAFDWTFGSWRPSFSRISRGTICEKTRGKWCRQRAAAQAKESHLVSALSIGKSKAKGGIFQHVSDSEENIRWETGVMHADKGKTLTEISNARHDGPSSGDEEEVPSGQIKVTQSTLVSRA